MVALELGHKHGVRLAVMRKETGVQPSHARLNRRLEVQAERILAWKDFLRRMEANLIIRLLQVDALQLDALIALLVMLGQGRGSYFQIFSMHSDPLTRPANFLAAH